MRKQLRKRCPACNGYGKRWEHVKDDSTASGYRNVEFACDACIAGVVLVTMPKKSRLPGVTRARCTAEINGNGSYDHPQITLLAPDAYTESKEKAVFVLSFQRNRIESRERERCPDPRFDFGRVGWSPAYAGRLTNEHDSRGFDLDHAETIRRAATVAEKITKARHEIPSAECELGLTVDALETLGVPVEIRYYDHASRRYLSADEMASEVRAGRIEIGKGAELVAENAA